MPTRQGEPEHDEVRHSAAENERATAEAEPNHPASETRAAGVESPSGDQMQGANGPALEGATAGLPPDMNQDDAPDSDQDIDTAGTEADEQSPTRSHFLALTPSLQRG